MALLPQLLKAVACLHLACTIDSWLVCCSTGEGEGLKWQAHKEGACPSSHKIPRDVIVPSVRNRRCPSQASRSNTCDHVVCGVLIFSTPSCRPPLSGVKRPLIFDQITYFPIRAAAASINRIRQPDPQCRVLIIVDVAIHKIREGSCSFRCRKFDHVASSSIQASQVHINQPIDLQIFHVIDPPIKLLR